MKIPVVVVRQVEGPNDNAFLINSINELMRDLIKKANLQGTIHVYNSPTCQPIGKSPDGNTVWLLMGTATVEQRKAEKSKTQQPVPIGITPISHQPDQAQVNIPSGQPIPVPNRWPNTQEMNFETLPPDVQHAVDSIMASGGSVVFPDGRIAGPQPAVNVAELPGHARLNGPKPALVRTVPVDIPTRVIGPNLLGGMLSGYGGVELPADIRAMASGSTLVGQNIPTAVKEAVSQNQVSPAVPNGSRLPNLPDF